MSQGATTRAPQASVAPAFPFFRVAHALLKTFGGIGWALQIGRKSKGHAGI